MEGGDAMGHELQGLVAAGRTWLSSVRGGSRGRSAQGTDGTGLGILGLALLTLELDACLSRGQPGHWTGFSGGLPHQIPVACPSAWVTTHNVPNLAICPPVKGYKTSLLAHKGERGNQAGSGRRGSGRGGDCDSHQRGRWWAAGRAGALFSSCDFSVLPEVSAKGMLLLCNQEETKPREGCFGVFFGRDSQEAISACP